MIGKMIYLRRSKEAIGEITEDGRNILKEIESFVLTLDSDRNSDFFRLSVLILAAPFITGPSVERLVELTSYPLQFVWQACNNMRASGLWTDEAIFAEWLKEDDTCEPLVLLLHTEVAKGSLTVRKEESGWTYKAVPVQ